MTQSLYLAAYIAALYYWWRIRGDFPQAGAMRRALTWLCASCVCSLLRHATELTGNLYGWNADQYVTVRSLRQIPIALALLFLIASLLEMLRSFRLVGLGIRIRGTDVLWMAVILALVPPILLGRENLSDAQSGVLLIRVTQWASPLLLAIPALLGVVLHRVSREMAGGYFALSLQLLVASLTLRLFSLAIFVWLRLEYLSTAVPILASFLFAFAAWNRWRATVRVSEISRRYRDRPAGELGELC